MNSQYVMFTCANCRDSTTYPSATPRHSSDSLNVKSMEDLIIRVESSLVDLQNQSINITSLLTSSNHISHASPISNPLHITATKHIPHYSLIILHLQAHIINLHTFLFLFLLHLLLRILILLNGICLF